VRWWERGCSGLRVGRCLDTPQPAPLSSRPSAPISRPPQLRVDDSGQLALVGGHEFNATWIQELRAPLEGAGSGGDGGEAPCGGGEGEGGGGQTCGAAGGGAQVGRQARQGRLLGGDPSLRRGGAPALRPAAPATRTLPQPPPPQKRPTARPWWCPVSSWSWPAATWASC
jgi:hypothetical protein